MSSRSWIGPLIALLAAASPAHGQEGWGDNGVDDRLEALVAVLDFRRDLFAADSVYVADCRIEEQISREALEALPGRFRDLLIPSLKPDDEALACAVFNFAYDDVEVYWLESLFLVERSGSSATGPINNTRWELRFQHLKGPGYREYHSYVVAPSVGYDPETQTMYFDRFRVVEFEMLGESSHWADGAPMDWVAAIYDPEVHYLLDEIWGGKASMRTNRDRMRGASERLLRMVREAKGG